MHSTSLKKKPLTKFKWRTDSLFFLAKHPQRRPKEREGKCNISNEELT